jgi:glyoxylase-like metal-dependent hydrolase (beta-lactamase superfamily II)
VQIKRLAEGFIGANCYLLSSNGHAMIVDPCARTEIITAAVEQAGLVLDGILLTHGHFDHMMSLEALLQKYPVPVYLGAGDRDFPSDGRKNAFSLFFGCERTFPEATDLLRDGDLLVLGNEEIRVISTPGHSGGSSCFYVRTDGEPSILLTGDTLFADCTGRTDLYGGSDEILRDSLLELLSLSRTDNSIVIYPGHGESELLTVALRAVL